MKFLSALLTFTLLAGCSRTRPDEPAEGPLPPSEVGQQFKEAAAIAKKLLDNYRAEGLEQFTHRKPGEFDPLIKAGVLTDEDSQVILRHGLKNFSFRRSAAFSRRFEFSFDTGPSKGLMVELNHNGELVWGDVGEQDVSTDLAADVTVMWAIDAEGRTPAEAIPVASRVFNTVKLVGMHRDDIVERLGDPRTRRPGGKYNFPFWPASRRDLVYRFDTGAYGWQFNIKLNSTGVCSDVERHWIH